MIANFIGSVTAQNQAGETVTIEVTKPDGTKETLSAQTLADKSFTTTKEYTIAGSYSAIASIPEDAVYQAAVTQPIAFTVTLTARSITLKVTF